jgi:HNH endonuclease
VYQAARTVAMRAANYRCVYCGAPASEVHHVQYPPWGTFDVPANMEPVCHACHCRIEGKS